MGIFDGALRDMFGTSTARSASNSYINDFSSFFAGSSNTAKVSKSGFKNSLKLSAVYDAVNQISNDVAKIPFGVYQKNDNTRNRIAGHPIDFLISKEPNFYMTSFIRRKMVVTSILLRGNSLEIIKASTNGIPTEFEFVPWEDVIDIIKKDGDLIYKIKGHAKAYLSSEVLHYKGFTHNGIVGVGAITYAAQNMNIAIEVQNFSATNFESKGVRQGFISTDKVLGGKENPDAKKAIREGWRNAMAERSADRVVVLDEGMTFTPIAITPQEAQIVEMAKFGIEDIARWFNIPLHKIKSMGNSTNNNIEQQSLDYAVDCIHPYVTNIEQEDGKKLFTKKEKEAGFYIHGNLNVLLRADIKSKGEYYSKMANSGIHSRNEIRALEDMNPGPELLNEFLTPVNTFTEKQIENNLKRIGDGNAK
jgi:HK97 family phage portal protein